MNIRYRIECPKYHQIVSKEGIKSNVWECFGFPGDENDKIINERICICKLCSCPVSCTSTSNLWSHLRIHHPPQYKILCPKTENRLQIPDQTENSTPTKTPTPAENSSFMKQEAPPEPDVVTVTSEVESEVSLDNSTPPPSMHHVVVYNDRTTQVVPNKRLRTDHFPSKENFIQQSPTPKAASEDPSELFLRSLLPDIAKLNPSKLRHFKTFVITKLTDLLDEQDAEIATRNVAGGLSNPYVVDSCSVEP